METKLQTQNNQTKYKIGNILYNFQSKDYFKLYELNDEKLVWQINFGFWGTLENFKNVIKNQKQKLILVDNYITNPKVLNEIKKPFFNLENYLSKK